MMLKYTAALVEDAKVKAAMSNWLKSLTWAHNEHRSNALQVAVLAQAIATPLQYMHWLDGYWWTIIPTVIFWAWVIAWSRRRSDPTVWVWMVAAFGPIWLTVMWYLGNW